jgi:hypothetical protein
MCLILVAKEKEKRGTRVKPKKKEGEERRSLDDAAAEVVLFLYFVLRVLPSFVTHLHFLLNVFIDYIVNNFYV